MAAQRSRAKYPARMTFQLSSELKAQLLEVAERDHEGDVQALGRQCLEARVERRGAVPDQLAEILDALERLSTETAGRHLEQRERVNQLLEQGERMFAVMNDDLTKTAGRHLEQREQVNQLLEQGERLSKVLNGYLMEMMEIRDDLKKLAGRPAEQ